MAYLYYEIKTSTSFDYVNKKSLTKQFSAPSSKTVTNKEGSSLFHNSNFIEMNGILWCYFLLSVLKAQNYILVNLKRMHIFFVTGLDFWPFRLHTLKLEMDFIDIDTEKVESYKLKFDIMIVLMQRTEVIFKSNFIQLSQKRSLSNYKLLLQFSQSYFYWTDKTWFLLF